ncbi:MAG: translation elongation factor Ts [Gemmataceae bacterium]|nr:translation elongation factor Ts [Gemmataceae bacterium]MCI0741770.1 translation elongation factor Ts [Gemmataceae bacterium]
MRISAADVKSLRDRTNMPMMECKSALVEAGGDMDKAVEILRKKHKEVVVKRGDREAAEGRIAVFIDENKRVGAILEMRCESAPVVKAEQFVKLANDLAKQVALKNPASVDELLAQPSIDDAKKTCSDLVAEVIGVIRENMKPKRFTRLEGLLGAYSHHDGSVGVMVQVEGDKADTQLLRDISMHITAKNPVAARREDVPAETIAKETEIAREQIANDPKNKSKPANILEKIIEGKIKTWLAENVLVEQPSVKDDSKTVGELLKSAGLTMGRFIRYKVGELN